MKRPFNQIWTHLVLVAAILGAVAPEARADGALCPTGVERASTRPTAPTFRTMASRFAPYLSIRVWMRVDDHLYRRDRHPADWPSTSSTSAPAGGVEPLRGFPTKRRARRARPIGWQISVRWDLVEIAEIAVPELDQPTPRLRPSTCSPTQRRRGPLRPTMPTGDMP